MASNSMPTKTISRDERITIVALQEVLAEALAETFDGMHEADLRETAARALEVMEKGQLVPCEEESEQGAVPDGDVDMIDATSKILTGDDSFHANDAEHDGLEYLSRDERVARENALREEWAEAVTEAYLMQFTAVVGLTGEETRGLEGVDWAQMGEGWAELFER